jgi:ribosomal protein S18 acetylase RimI-like enzyme
VGAALLDLVVEHFRREGASRVVMSTLPRMQAAQRIYQRAGFTRLPERDWAPAPGIDLIAYGLELVPS